MSSLRTEAYELIDQMSEDSLDLIVKLMKKIIISDKAALENKSGVKYGIAKGKFTVPDDIDECNEELFLINNSSNETGKRIGVAKELNFPSDFDNIDYQTEDLFTLTDYNGKTLPNYEKDTTERMPVTTYGWNSGNNSWRCGLVWIAFFLKASVLKPLIHM